MRFVIFLALVLFLCGLPSGYAADEIAPPGATNPETAYDTSFILGKITIDGGFVSYNPPMGNCSVYTSMDFRQNSQVLVAGIHECEETYTKRKIPFYEIMISGISYYITPGDLVLAENDKKRLEEMPPAIRSEFRKKVEEASIYLRAKARAEALKAVEKTSKRGLTLLKSSIYDTSEYTDGTGFKVTVLNPTKKVIKYVSFTVVGYNSVKDPVQQGGRKRTTSITVKGVGPIEKGSSASYDWEYLWFSDLVQTFKITSIKVDYMDGSKRTISNMNEITLSPEHVATIFEL